MAIINGREYEWADVTVIGAGRDIIGVLGVEYSEKQEKELLYGKGNKATGIQKGNKSCEGSLKVRQSELEGLEDLSASHSILDLQINLAVSYGDPGTGTPMRTDKLYTCSSRSRRKESTRATRSKRSTCHSSAQRLTGTPKKSI